MTLISQFYYLQKLKKIKEGNYNWPATISTFTGLLTYYYILYTID